MDPSFFLPCKCSVPSKGCYGAHERVNFSIQNNIEKGTKSLDLGTEPAHEKALCYT